MRAAIIHAHGDRDVITLVTDYIKPTAKAGWVVLKVGATSLNFHNIFPDVVCQV